MRLLHNNLPSHYLQILGMTADDDDESLMLLVWDGSKPSVNIQPTSLSQVTESM